MQESIKKVTNIHKWKFFFSTGLRAGPLRLHAYAGRATVGLQVHYLGPLCIFFTGLQACRIGQADIAIPT